MKLYLVFKGHDYYPSPGLGDCVGSYTDRQLAYVTYANLKVDSYQWKELWSIDLETQTWEQEA